jgi:ATP-dependent RNA helicase RhlE
MSTTENIPNLEQPSPSFESLNLHPEIMKGIRDLGFTRPTPIQAKAIPAVLSGRDVIGLAQTGTGKTAAFVLPTLDHLLKGQSGVHLRALILSPTREIAQQSIDQLKALSRYVRLTGTAIYGGTPMEPQIKALLHGVDIVSATPGRLMDHIYSGRISFRDLEILVLDEVDRMLDMGFAPDILRIISFLPEKRQNLAFSATMPKEIEKLLAGVMKDPVTVQVGQRSSVAVGIRHAVYPVPRHLKTELLIELLRGDGLNSVIVFTRTKHMADRLGTQLIRRGIRTSILHGDRSQNQRTHAMEAFRAGRTQVMVATDIAARGIDISDITHVINFDMPNTPEDYVHRIGRTARAEATGDAFSLVDREEEAMVREIEKVMKKPLPRVTLPNFDYKKAAPQGSSHGGGHSRGGRPGGHGGGHSRGGRPGGHGPSRPR